MLNQVESIVFIGGGTGTPKLIQGFREIIEEECITVIGNTADDIVLNGLYISPDVDTFLYMFANILDTDKFWGIKDDTMATHTFLQKLDPSIWFTLGDKDLAIHMFRTQKLNENYTLSQITEILSKRLGIKATILPCTDNHIETRIVTQDGEDIHFQEYWVKHRSNIEIRTVYTKGKEDAKVPKQVLEAIDKSEIIVIGPSNPVTSIGPIIELEEIRTKIQENREKCVAISPIIGEQAISGPTCKLLKTKNMECSILSVVSLYSDVIGTFIIDESDRHKKVKIERDLRIEVLSEKILFRRKEDAVNLARKILELKV
ncbi:MAG: 2-phospho-L-lactate transferase [Candidatus Heimdallarchaeaceae archaeon]